MKKTITAITAALCLAALLLSAHAPESKKLSTKAISSVATFSSVTEFRGMSSNGAAAEAALKDHGEATTLLMVNGILLPQSSLLPDSGLVPVREVCMAMGAYLTWDAETSSAVIRSYHGTSKISAGSTLASVNSEAIRMEAPAELHGSKLYAPLSFMTKALGSRAISCDLGPTTKPRSSKRYRIVSFENHSLPSLEEVLGIDTDVTRRDSYTYAN
ncbi:MAG: copper amine oxidase N-terminal domain-containing protein [Clostridiales bacterium]|jgi:hypothetical protein|nr:copper amine oxidase N-terminal domain-containing protein [Clostridiales bacterium]MDR2749295.1 copper amine oxidase N-terminal domain-containing protein [Clostridiales bacterium]